MPIQPGGKQRVQQVIVRASGHYDGVDYIIQCANCEAWYSLLNVRLPIIAAPCGTRPEDFWRYKTVISTREDLLLQAVSFVCEVCYAEHGLPGCCLEGLRKVGDGAINAGA